MTLVGGMGTVFGLLVQGTIFVVVVRLFRRGVVGEIAARIGNKGGGV